MIKKFNLYKESLLNKLEGPSEEEVFKSISDLSPNGMLLRSCKINFLPGVKLAYERQPKLLQTQEYEALGICCIYGSLDVLKYLVEYEGLNPKIKNNKCIKYAIENGHIEIIKYLIDNNYFTERNDITFLYSAITYHNFYIMKLLINNGWIVNDRLIDDLKRIKGFKKDLGEEFYESLFNYLIRHKE